MFRKFLFHIFSAHKCAPIFIFVAILFQFGCATTGGFYPGTTMEQRETYSTDLDNKGIELRGGDFFLQNVEIKAPKLAAFFLATGHKELAMAANEKEKLFVRVGRAANVVSGVVLMGGSIYLASAGGIFLAVIPLIPAVGYSLYTNAVDPPKSAVKAVETYNQELIESWEKPH